MTAKRFCSLYFWVGNCHMDDRAAQTAEDDDASKRRMEMTKDMGLLECTQTAVVVMSDDRELEPEEQPTVMSTAAVSDRKWGDYPLTSDEVALLEQQEQMKETAAYVHKLRDELSEARAQAEVVQEKLEEMTSKFEAAQDVAESTTAEHQVGAKDQGAHAGLPGSMP